MAARRRFGVDTLVMAGAVALAVGFVGGRMSASGGDGEQAGPKEVSPAEGSQGSYEEKDLDLPPSPSKGPEDARVVVHEMSDFQCPFCSKATDAVDRIHQEFPDRVRVVFKHNPLGMHDRAKPAAIASMAAAKQGHFWKYHDQLFANQKSLSREDLVGYAEDLGLDVESFEKDLDSEALARKVDLDYRASQAVGATSTPTFFVNGIKLKGAKKFEDFKKKIESELEATKKLAEEGASPDGIVKKRIRANADNATDFIKYVIQGAPAPKTGKDGQAGDGKKKKKKDEGVSETVWQVPVDPEKDHIKGPKHAPVTVVEFSDFECPFCSKVVDTYEKIHENYPEDVRIVFKHNPLSMHDHAEIAAQAAEAAAAQGKFWEMHDKLFENQKALTKKDLVGYAEDLGLDVEPFEKALDSGKYADAVQADKQLASKVKAKGTPNHYINGRGMNGAKPYETFEKIIEEELKAAKKRIDEGTPVEEVYDEIVADGKTFSPISEDVKDIPVGDSPYKGSEDAPITIIEFSDFECPFCSRVVKPLSRLASRYPDQVQVVFKHFPLSQIHDHAQKASEAAEAAREEGKFWAMHDLLFQNQKSLETEALVAYGKQVGLAPDELESDLKSGTYEDRVKEDLGLGKKVGVRGTPTVFINGRKYKPSGGYSLKSMEKILSQEFGLEPKEG